MFFYLKYNNYPNNYPRPLTPGNRLEPLETRMLRTRLAVYASLRLLGARGRLRLVRLGCEIGLKLRKTKLEKLPEAWLKLFKARLSWDSVTKLPCFKMLQIHQQISKLRQECIVGSRRNSMTGLSYFKGSYFSFCRPETVD